MAFNKDAFVSRIKTMDEEILKRYSNVLGPNNVCDFFHYFLSDRRRKNYEVWREIFRKKGVYLE